MLFPDSKIPEGDGVSFPPGEKWDDKIGKIEEVFWSRWRLDKTEIRRKLYAYIAEE